MTTKRVEGVVRNSLTGVGEGGVTVAINKVSDDSTVTSTTTDAGADLGYYSRLHDTVGYPGPVYEAYTLSTTTKKRDGRVHGQLAGLIWADDVGDVFSLLGIGVANGLVVSANGSSMAPSVSAGLALLKDGLPYLQEGAIPVQLDEADGTNPRIDRIILRETREGQTDQGKIALTKITGQPAGSPAAPGLTQSSATWDFPLAQVLVGAGVTTIAADKVTDERTYCFVYPTGLVAGDLFYINASGVLTRLPKGTSGQFLKIGATIPAWTSVANTDISGLGTMSTQVASAVAITGGTVAGITDLAVADGGTGVSTAAAARTNLGLGTIATQDATAVTVTDLTATGNAALGNGDSDVHTMQGRFRKQGAAPSVAYGTGAGTGPSGSGVTGNDEVIRWLFTTGTSPAASATVATFTFATVKPDTNYIVDLIALDPSSQAAIASGVGLYYDDASRSTTQFLIKVGTGALAASTGYRIGIIVREFA